MTKGATKKNPSSKQWESLVVLSLTLARFRPPLGGGLSFDGSTITSLPPSNQREQSQPSLHVSVYICSPLCQDLKDRCKALVSLSPDARLGRAKRQSLFIKDAWGKGLRVATYSRLSRL